MRIYCKEYGLQPVSDIVRDTFREILEQYSDNQIRGVITCLLQCEDMTAAERRELTRLLMEE